MIDELFDYKFGKLGWRSLEFKFEQKNSQNYQQVAVMNFADENIPYTRVHEFKHFHIEREVFNTDKTFLCFEYPKSHNLAEDAYYPIRDKQNSELYELYENEAKKNPNLIIGGRLGAYEYWNMDKTIENALECFKEWRKNG